MLQNAYFLAKIGADTAENEQHFAEILSKTGNYPTGARARASPPPGPRGGEARGTTPGPGRRNPVEVEAMSHSPFLSEVISSQTTVSSKK